MPLNEECGVIEWVPDTTTMRNIILKTYKARKVPMLPVGLSRSP